MNKSELEGRKQAIWQGFEKRWGCSFPEETRAKTERDALGGVYDEDGLAALKNYLGDVSPLLYAVVNSNDRQPESNTASPKKRYQKSFQKRLHLVSWVAERKQGNRIGWKALCLQWNEEHPYDLMTPAVLKVEYHRAKSDKLVQQEYAKFHYSQYAPKITEFALRAENSSLVQDRLWGELGRIALFQGEGTMAGTMSFTSIALSQSRPARATEVDY